MKPFVVILFLALGIQGAMSQNDDSGNDCFVPAVCSKSGFSEMAWMSISRPVCEANIAMKGVQGDSGPVGLLKGEDGPQGEDGQPGPKGDNGTRGVKGSKGDIGVIGPKGANGTQGNAGQPGPKGENGTTGGIGPKGEPASAESLDIANRIKVLCPVIHDNKCFIAVIGRKVNYDDGVAICESRGGNLANIYSQTHMDDVMKYIRENRMDGSTEKCFRLGMKYDPKANKLTLRDGSDASAGLKWYSDYPHNVEARGERVAGYTNVVLGVRGDQSSTGQYLFNAPPSTTSTTCYVLCEIE